MTKNQNKALWIFPNIKESVDMLPESLRGKAWEMIINYAFGDENVEQNCKNLKVLLAFRVVKPLLRLRGIAGSQNGKSNNPSGLAKNNEPNITPNIGSNITPNSLNNNNRNNLTETETENKKQKLKKEIYKEKFEEWWSYFPKLRAGNKTKTFEKYIKTIEKEKLTPEWLLERVKEYSKSREVENGYACGGERYFNDCKYNNHYELSEKEKAREEERRLTSNWWRE